jgi:hypothetical protein
MFIASMNKTEKKVSKRRACAPLELPTITFNRICYGYLHNDWSTVVSSSITLLVTLSSLILSSVSQGRL